MLKHYNTREDIQTSNPISRGYDRRLQYYASDVMKKLGYTGEDDMSKAMAGVFKICQSLNVPVAANFRQVSRAVGDDHFARDWKLSSFARYLLVMNSNPCNPKAARAQWDLVSSDPSA
jgi:hypothetical protein